MVADPASWANAGPIRAAPPGLGRRRHHETSTRASIALKIARRTDPERASARIEAGHIGLHDTPRHAGGEQVQGGAECSVPYQAGAGSAIPARRQARTSSGSMTPVAAPARPAPAGRHAGEREGAAEHARGPATSSTSAAA
jgi:hypothetical protein